MQVWILEADIYRLTKAMELADKTEKARIAQHLRRAEALLGTMKQPDISLRRQPNRVSRI